MPSPDVFSVIVDSLLSDGLSVRFRASGRSMLPTVCDGECLIVAPVDPRQVRPGDVVLCATVRGPVVHRVTGVRFLADGARSLTLRGDASLKDDRQPVLASQIRGRVVGVERAGRTLGVSLPGLLGRMGRATRARVRPALIAAGQILTVA